MIAGTNTVFRHDDHEYHIQAEDLGGDTVAFEIRVYEGGTVLFQKRVDYQDVVDQGLNKADFEHALRTKMEKMILTVQAAISKGKIP